MERKFDLEDRLVDYAALMIELVKDLPNDDVGNYYGNQILRSSGSSALNFGKTQRTNTLKDYISRDTIVIRELKESRVNLRIFTKARYGINAMLEQLLDETEQLVKIIATIIINKKQQHKLGKK